MQQIVIETSSVKYHRLPLFYDLQVKTFKSSYYSLYFQVEMAKEPSILMEWTNPIDNFFNKKMKIKIKKTTLNKYKTQNFPNNKQFNTAPEDDLRNGRKRLS